MNASHRPLDRRSQRGSALIIALVIVAVMMIILTALVSFANTNQRASVAFRKVRDERYAANAALDAAVNWAKAKPTVGRDPYLFPSDDPCVVNYEGLKVSCQAPSGEGSGAPADVGQVPPEALVMLGERQRQPGPHPIAVCNGVWDKVEGFFNDAVAGLFGGNAADLAAVGEPEPSARFGTQKNDNWFSCKERTRTYHEFAVQGKIAAAGNLVVSQAGSKLSAVNALGQQLASGGIVAGGTCTGDIKPACVAPGTRSNQPFAYLNGTSEDTDPARTNPNSPAQNPTDIHTSWATLPISSLVQRSPKLATPSDASSGEAYTLNADGSLTPVTTCSGADKTIVFLPGWYRSAQFLSGFTKSPSCKGVTFWFAPNPGPDGKLLTGDEVSGAFLLDFRLGAAVQCHGDLQRVSTWCVGGSNDQNARIVVGQPNGWSPVDPGSVGAPGQKDVVIGRAGTIDNDLSVRWYNENNTRVIDGTVATYTPCDLWLFNCPSVDRAIRLRDFTPKVTGPPVSETGLPAGRVWITVAYGMEHGDGIKPQVVVEAVSKDSGRKSCGTFDLESKAYSGSGPVPQATISQRDAEILAARCGTVDLLNGLEVKFQAVGNWQNNGNPKIFLDGVKVTYRTFSGASFPYPDASAADPVAAKSDCDPHQPGGQLIFTGESNMYIADGSLEVCAGPYPTDPSNHQSIGVYAVPAVAPVVPVDVWKDGGTVKNGNQAIISLDSVGSTAAAKLKIGEPGSGDLPNVRVTYGNCGVDCDDGTVVNKSTWAGAGSGEAEGRIGIRMAAYEAPPGFQIKRIDARVSYNTHNSCVLWCVANAVSKLQVGTAGREIDLPRNPNRMQYANAVKLRVYERGSPANDIDLNTLENGQQTFVFKARANSCVAAFGIWTCAIQYTDELEGLELDITLEPTNTSAPALIPQSGCTTAHTGYVKGEGEPDCAVIKADATQAADIYNAAPWSPSREGYWAGRLSVKGTIYAPSSAIEIDEGDNAYPLATRGAVLRHLRVSGWKFRSGYSKTPISNEIDRTPAAREADFIVCKPASGSVASSPCGPSDTKIAAARVRFDVENGQAVVPNIVWRTTDVD